MFVLFEIVCVYYLYNTTRGVWVCEMLCYWCASFAAMVLVLSTKYVFAGELDWPYVIHICFGVWYVACFIRPVSRCREGKTLIYTYNGVSNLARSIEVIHVTSSSLHWRMMHKPLARQCRSSAKDDFGCCVVVLVSLFTFWWNESPMNNQREFRGGVTKCFP